MDENIALLTNNIKTENTTKIYIPTSSFKNFVNSENITINPGLSDVNASHLLHSISYLYNFTVILSGSILNSGSSNILTYNEDVYKTFKPYCTGTGGGII